MGSFLWDDDFDDMCYSQHYHGRPLSVALTEPYDPFEPQSCSFFDDVPYIESDFTSLRPQVYHRHHHHQHQREQHHHEHRRSHSSGRRYKREYYSVNYPQGYTNTYCFSPPPPPPLPPRRPIHRVSSRDVLIEKIQTVTIEEPPRRPPAPYVVSCIRAPSPPVRQLKIRPRPTSCFDLRKETLTDNRHQHEKHWSKIVDERREEQYEYSYNFQKSSDRIVPIEREPPIPPPPRPPTPPRIRLYDAMTSTEDLYIPPPPKPTPIYRETKTIGTTTSDLPRRPLSMTETQIIDRVEKTEKVRRDSTSSTEGAALTLSLSRMYTPEERRKEKARVIVRTTAGPREALVDTSGIFGFPGEFSEPNSPIGIESGLTNGNRNPFRSLHSS